MKTLDNLDDTMRYWLTDALKWADAKWDDEVALLRVPTERRRRPMPDEVHIVRESVWYALGLLMRQENDDVERAGRAIEAIMRYQFDTPSTIYHGTFRRYTEEPTPPENPTVWQDYDPNWREFICTVFILMLIEFRDLLPTPLQDKMLHSIQLATEGTIIRRVDAQYTNIALMSAFLLDYAGKELNKPAWREFGTSLAQEIYDLFRQHGTFYEYNSPTYYGVDIYALGLWRKYGLTSLFQSLGAEMEAELWRDIAQFYHAGLRNLCGPYDRSYGMDMTDYIAVIGLWIAAGVPIEIAPMPDVSQPFEHAGDYFFVPLVALVDAIVPEDTMPHLMSFQGERLVERTIETGREFTAWLSPSLMLGGGRDGINNSRTDQYYPATAHWIAPDGSVAWLRSCTEHLIQAEATSHELRLWDSESHEYDFIIRVPDANTNMIQGNTWQLPGMHINIETENAEVSAKVDNGILTVQIRTIETLRLRFLSATT